MAVESIQEDYGSRSTTDLFCHWKKYCLLESAIQYPSSLVAFGDLKDKTLLDVGCGDGNFMRFCKQNGAARLQGLDASAYMLKLAEKLNNEAFPSDGKSFSLSLIEDCFEPIELVDLPEFDFAAVNYVLPHCSSLPKLQTLCHNLFKYLKPGGKAILITSPFFVSNSAAQKVISDIAGYKAAIKPETEYILDPVPVTSVALRPDYENCTGNTTRYTDLTCFEWNEYYWKSETICESFETAGFSAVQNVPRIIHPDYNTEQTRKALELPTKDWFIHLVATK